MGRDDPVTRVGNEISETEMGNKMEGMGWGGDPELLWIRSESVSHAIISGTFLI